MIRDYCLRVAATAFFGLGAVATAGMLLLLPAYGYLSARGEISAVEPPSALTEKIKSEEAALLLAQEMLVLLPQEGSELLPSEVIARVRAAAASAGVDVLSVMQRSSGDISVRGLARTREALIAFGKSLKDDPALASISIPVELLAKNRNISFDLRGKLPSDL